MIMLSVSRTVFLCFLRNHEIGKIIKQDKVPKKEEKKRLIAPLRCFFSIKYRTIILDL